MADKAIGELPKATSVNDDSKLLMEQGGEAMYFEGKVIKDYVAPYANSAQHAAASAQSAYAGVKEAIENIPEGAATPIVNDLTTGGTQMALSAEMGKLLGAHASRHAVGGIDPITPSMIGALAASNGTIAESALDDAKTPGHYLFIDTLGLFGSTGFAYDLEVSRQLYASVHEAIVQKATRVYCGANNSVTYERAYYYANIISSDGWTPWKQLATTDYALARDGSNTMTGQLGIESLPDIAHYMLLRVGGDTTVGIENVKKDGTTGKHGLWIASSKSHDHAHALILESHTEDGSFASDYVLHTGNKPSGSYTGNGDATERTIEIGGIGSVVAIMGPHGICIASAAGAIGAVGGSATVGFGAGTFRFASGSITMTSSHELINESGATYYYQVL